MSNDSYTIRMGLTQNFGDYKGFKVVEIFGVSKQIIPKIVHHSIPR